MRIFIYTNWYVKQSIVLANALCAAHQVAMVIPRPRPGDAPSDGVVYPDQLARTVDRRVHVMQIPFMQGLTPLGLLSLWRAWRLARAFAPDVVQLHESYDLRALLLRLLLPGTVFALTVHDPVAHGGERIGMRRFKHWVRDELRKRATGLVVLSPALRTLLTSKSSEPMQRVFSVPHGPLSTRGPAPRMPVKGSEKRILFFGRWEAYKGIDVLILAAPLIWSQFPSVIITLAGCGRVQLGELLPDAGARRLFDIRNYAVPDDEVADLFSRADVVVLPYREATQSGPLHLAASYGKPVVASAVGGIPDVVQDGETGLLVPPRDPKALATAICSLLADPEKAERIGHAAWESLAGERALDVLEDRYIAAYRAMVEIERAKGGAC